MVTYIYGTVIKVVASYNLLGSIVYTLVAIVASEATQGRLHDFGNGAVSLLRAKKP